MDTIRMRGVRVHNLKNLDVEIPRGKLTVITGPSGSGKSSLAFDTLYAEGQRRYVESLSTYARQFLERVDRPDVDAIDGLPPAIAIQQKGTVTSGRSTVGTSTEIYDYLRLLYARIGRTFCTRCGREVREETVERVVSRLLREDEGDEDGNGKAFRLPEIEDGGVDGPAREQGRGSAGVPRPAMAPVSPMAHGPATLKGQVTSYGSAMEQIPTTVHEPATAHELATAHQPSPVHEPRVLHESAMERTPATLAAEPVRDEAVRPQGGGAPRRLTITFPLEPGKVLESVSAPEFLADLRANGFLRILLDGAPLSIDDPAAAAITKASSLAVVVDRIAFPGAREAKARAGRAVSDAGGHVSRAAGMVSGATARKGEDAAGTDPRSTSPSSPAQHPGDMGALVETGASAGEEDEYAALRRRLAEAVETAYRFGHGRLLVMDEQGRLERFSETLHCAGCDIEYRKPTPAFFSFNSPLGACPACQGFGRSILLDPDLIVPDKGKTLAEGPVDPWNKPSYRGAYDDLKKAGRKIGLRWDIPYDKLPDRQRRLVDEGEGDWYGIKGFFEWLETKIYKVHVRVFLSRYRTYRTCTTCGGGRLRAEVLAVKVGGLDIAQVCRMTISWNRSFFDSLELTEQEEEISLPILKEIRRRLRYLDEVGLEYLTLDRMSRTLSGGESQRIGLASCLGSGLVGTLYVLDEPSIGLHPRDSDRLIRVVSELRDLGNTIVVVEHDEAMIRASDRIIDLGPAAGEKGGEIVAQGTPQEVSLSPASRTGAFLSGNETISVPGRRRAPVRGRWLELLGARANNLKDIDVRIPLGLFTCITGVSGSGKSSLIEETLYPAILRAKGRGSEKAARANGAYRELRGADRLHDAVMVDQSPIGKTPRSNPVTYIKAFDEIRRLFAAQRSARAAGLEAGDFSFNVPGGRCDVCEGQGVVTTEMQFLADVVLPCEACGGKRFKQEVLAVRRGGRSIADVLEMTVDEAIRFFAGQATLVSRLEGLARTGLGYLRLGQPATTLSGGESQRLKLAAAMYGGGTGVLYIFDEPTTGLHFADVGLLLRCFERLVGNDNTVLVVEHQMDVVKCADWVIDLGPEGGDAGGRVVVQGTPDEVARADTHTARYVARALESPLSRV